MPSSSQVTRLERTSRRARSIVGTSTVRTGPSMSKGTPITGKCRTPGVAGGATKASSSWQSLKVMIIRVLVACTIMVKKLSGLDEI